MVKVNIKNIQYILLTFFFTVEMVPDFRTSSLWWWMCVGLLCVLFALDSLQNCGRLIIKLKPFDSWYISFVGYSLLSIVWASNKDNTLSYIPTILITCLICIILSQIIRTEADLNAVLFARYLASVILCLYMYTNIDLSVFGDERIGVSVLGDGWNSNTIALKLTVGCILGIEQFKVAEKLFVKILLLASVVGMFTVMLFCGSRTALIIGVCGIAAYLWLSGNGKKKKAVMLCLIILGIFGLYHAIMNIPGLYNVLGSRLDILEEGLKGNTLSGSGTALRLMMIKDGIQVFLDNPILGVGMNNFRNVFGSMYGIYKYSHSNHIEVLANFGTIGAIIFFSGFIYLIKKGTKGILSNKKLNQYQILSLCSVLILFVSGFGSIYYMQSNEMILLTLCFSGIYLNEKNYSKDAATEQSNGRKVVDFNNIITE